MAASIGALVSGQWLAGAIKNIGPKLRVLDTSWYLPKTKRDPRAEYAQRHIPGSLFFDIDECGDPSSELAHTMPDAELFSRYVGDLGIGNDTHVVVYDTSDAGSYSAPRVWWMFRVFGHASVSVLDGGLKHWLAEGHPVTSEATAFEPARFGATANASWMKSYEDVLHNVEAGGEVQVVDARPAGRFHGTEPEPRDDIKPGHFPYAINMPFTSFLDASGKVLGMECLAKKFEKAGVDLKKPLWASCGSGVTSCQVALAAHLLGHPGVCIYVGSWTEWFKKAPRKYVIPPGDGSEGKGE